MVTATNYKGFLDKNRENTGLMGNRQKTYLFILLFMGWLVIEEGKD